MRQFITRFLLLIFAIPAFALAALAQQEATPAVEIADDGVPVLVKHLPDWEIVQKSAVVTNNPADLEKATGKRPVLEAVEFIAGTEAATADYNQGKLVIVEFTTPQAAVDADARIKGKINETGQTPPQTVYRKVGNYAVFVFDAPDEASANSLIDKITYQKTVQWLGDNPYPLLQAQREFNVTTSDIVVTTVKVAGMALLAALVLGGTFGTIVFYRRRREQAETFSDAGGMMRLNLDDLTPQTDPNRLLKS